jgi:excisionase family DNA binding protein
MGTEGRTPKGCLSMPSSDPIAADASNRAARRHRKQAQDNAFRGPYLSIAQTAEYLGVTERTVRQMIADGRLRGYRLGTRVIRLRRDEIDAAMQPFGGAA